MTDIKILHDALTKHNIPLPEPDEKWMPNAGGYFRWGKNQKFYAKEIVYRYDGRKGWLFGRFDEPDAKWTVFPDNISSNDGCCDDSDKHPQSMDSCLNQTEVKYFKDYDTAAAYAQKIWQNSVSANDMHGYLQRKHVRSFGLRQKGQSLVMPIFNNDGQLRSLQFIEPDGSKRYFAGGEKKGCYFTIGNVSNDKPIAIAEGYATAATVYQITKIPTVVALDVGNLEHVIKNLVLKYSHHRLIIVADNDIAADSAKNPGVDAANKLAATYGLQVIIPDIDGKTKNDMNDLFIQRGAESVRKLFNLENNGGKNG